MIIEHKGYLANVSYEDGDDLMHGEVLNTRATLHFAGKDIKALRKAFSDTVADYLAFCAERGIEPEKPYSGEFRLRLQPALHRALAQAAWREGQSLNAFIEKRLSTSVNVADVIAGGEGGQKKRRAAIDA